MIMKKDRRLLIGGHRGCKCSEYENTIGAINEGLRCGADYLEMDIQYTKDDKIVVFHDIVLDEERTNIFVKDISASELKIKYPYINMFEEVLEYYNNQDIYFAVEIKGSHNLNLNEKMEFTKNLNTIISKHYFVNKCHVFSIDYSFLDMLKKNNSEIKIGIISTALLSDPVSLMTKHDAEIYLAYLKNLSPEIITELHNHNYYVSCSVVNDIDAVKTAIGWGVDMLDTDFPGKICGYVNNLHLREGKVK
jgi:glycerophosphoryl diester phosphodiesterase